MAVLRDKGILINNHIPFIYIYYTWYLEHIWPTEIVMNERKRSLGPNGLKEELASRPWQDPRQRERELSDSKGSSPSWTVWFHGFIRRFFWEWFWSPKDSQGFLRLHVQNMSNSARLNPWISPKHIPYGYPCTIFLVFCKEIEVQLLDQARPNLPGLKLRT